MQVQNIGQRPNNEVQAWKNCLETHDCQTRCKTLSLDPLSCKYYCTDVVAPRPCTGGLNVDPTLKFIILSLAFGLVCSAKPSWFVSCCILLDSSSNAAPILCAPLLLCVEVCSFDVGSLIVVEGLRAIPLGSIVDSVMACVRPSTLCCQCFHWGENPLVFASSFFTEIKERLYFHGSWLLDYFSVAALLKSHRWVTARILHFLFCKYSIPQ